MGTESMPDDSIEGNYGGELVQKMLEELKGQVRVVRPPRVSSGRKELLLIGLEGQRDQEVLLVPRSKGHLAGAGAMVGTSGGT